MQIIAEDMMLYNVFVCFMIPGCLTLGKIIKTFIFISSDSIIISVMESHFSSHTFVHVIVKSPDIHIYIYSFSRHILIQIASTQVKLKSIQSYRIAVILKHPTIALW